jgi:hypothetical protein
MHLVAYTLMRPTEANNMVRALLGVVVGAVSWMVGFWILAIVLAQLWPDYAIHGRQWYETDSDPSPSGQELPFVP